MKKVISVRTGTVAELLRAMKNAPPKPQWEPGCDRCAACRDGCLCAVPELHAQAAREVLS